MSSQIDGVCGKKKKSPEMNKECKREGKEIQRQLFNQLHSEKRSTLSGTSGREGKDIRPWAMRENDKEKESKKKK